MADDNRPADGPGYADRAADRMHRQADRMHRQADRMGERLRRHCGSGGGPPAFFGVVLLVLGGLFLLDNLNIIETRSVWRSFWPLLFIGWGTSRVIAGDSGRFLPWLAIGGGTLFLANRMFGFPLNLARVFWPLVLIVLGAHIVFRAWSRPTVVRAAGAGTGAASFGGGEPEASSDAFADTSSTFEDSAFLGSIERRNVSQTFRGGAATAFIGSVEIDLRESRMASTEALVEVSVMMGSVALRIPRDWTVESRVSATMGSFEDLTDTPVDGSAKRLVVRGSAFMGSVEIRN
jgi:predicted membrane protein